MLKAANRAVKTQQEKKVVEFSKPLNKDDYNSPPPFYTIKNLYLYLILFLLPSQLFDLIIVS